MLLNDVKENVEKRYSKEAENKSMGCANLTPFFNIKRGDIVLDLGCGNGSQSMRLCEITGKNGFIYGLDITKEMIEKAKAKNDKKNVQFVIGDIHDLPFKNDLVDVIVSNCVINHSLDKRKVFSELYRVLKTGGHFLIGDVMSVGEIPSEIASDPENVADCWGGAIQKEKYLNIIEEIGFKNLAELSARLYYKNGFLLESIILKGEK